MCIYSERQTVMTGFLIRALNCRREYFFLSDPKVLKSLENPFLSFTDLIREHFSLDFPFVPRIVDGSFQCTYLKSKTEVCAKTSSGVFIADGENHIFRNGLLTALARSKENISKTHSKLMNALDS